MIEKKKIVIIGPAYPYRGGNSLYVSFLYDLLKDKFNVTIVNYKLLYPSILFPGTTQNDTSGHIIKEVESTRVINSVNPLTWFKAAKFIKAQNADIIIFDWWNPFFGPSHRVISSLIKKQYRNKIVFITENVISHEARFVDRLLTKIGLKNADVFIALSNVVENTLKNFTNKKIYKSALPIYGCYNLDKNIDVRKQKEILEELGERLYTKIKDGSNTTLVYSMLPENSRRKYNLKRGKNYVYCTFRAINLIPGKYYYEVKIGGGGDIMQDLASEAATFTIEASNVIYNSSSQSGLVHLNNTWSNIKPL